MASKLDTMNVSLPRAMKLRVEETVGAGEFTSSSEIVRAALADWFRARDERAVRIAWLQSKVDEGIAAFERGDYEEIDDIDAFVDEIWAKSEAKVAAGLITPPAPKPRKSSGKAAGSTSKDKKATLKKGTTRGRAKT